MSNDDQIFTGARTHTIETKAEAEIIRKHRRQMTSHEANHGKLGELQTKPTQEQLDKAFENAKKRGELFSQTTLGRQILAGQG